MAMLRKGIILAQHKEPAFSRPLVRFVSPQAETQIVGCVLPPNPAVASVDEIIEIAKAAQIVDERDGKMLHWKLLRAKGKAAMVVADAVDDEPYVSSKMAPLMQLTQEVLGGLELCRQVAGTGEVAIMVYKMLSKLDTKIPRRFGSVPVLHLYGGYPTSPPGSVLRQPGKKLIVGTGALIQLHRALWEGRRQATTFVTVAGNCIVNPMNLEVSLGMTVQQVLERCGVEGEPTRVVCGGPMTGFGVLSTDNTIITPTTSAVLAYRENVREQQYTCIGCGRCGQVCPEGLSPMYIHRFVENSYYAHLRTFDAHLCIGCGTCSYMCPSRQPVAVSVQKAREYALSHFIEPEEVDEFES